MRRIFVPIVAAFTLCDAGLAIVQSTRETGQSQSAESNPRAGSFQNPVPAAAKSIVQGKAVFAKYCRACHNDDAKGNGPMAPQGTFPPNLVDDRWEHGSTDADIFAVIKDGIGPAFDMKGYNSRLTPQEIWNVVNYLRSLGPQAETR